MSTAAVESPSTAAAPAAAVVALAGTSPCPYDKTRVVEKLDTPQGLVEICPYSNEEQIQQLMALIAPQLSEPYSIFTYRFFLEGWPELCFLVSSATPTM